MNWIPSDLKTISGDCSYQGEIVKKVEERVKGWKKWSKCGRKKWKRWKHKSVLAGKPSAATFYQILLPPQRITQSNKILLALGTLKKRQLKPNQQKRGLRVICNFLLIQWTCGGGKMQQLLPTDSSSQKCFASLISPAEQTQCKGFCLSHNIWLWWDSFLHGLSKLAANNLKWLNWWA